MLETKKLKFLERLSLTLPLLPPKYNRFKKNIGCNFPSLLLNSFERERENEKRKADRTKGNGNKIFEKKKKEKEKWSQKRRRKKIT